jgi:succinate dehydrogenase/fumarate reductase-like Fe-S protein
LQLQNLTLSAASACSHRTAHTIDHCSHHAFFTCTLLLLLLLLLCRWVIDSRDDFTAERLAHLDDAYKIYRCKVSCLMLVPLQFVCPPIL